MSFGWKVLVQWAVLGLRLAVLVLAQSDNSATAGQPINAAGDSMEQAGSVAATTAEHAYHRNATAARDINITAKVKTALVDDRATSHSVVHVATSAGVVTLEAQLLRPTAAACAERLAQNTEGVKEVNNKLAVSGGAMGN